MGSGGHDGTTGRRIRVDGSSRNAASHTELGDKKIGAHNRAPRCFLRVAWYRVFVISREARRPFRCDQTPQVGHSLRLKA